MKEQILKRNLSNINIGFFHERWREEYSNKMMEGVCQAGLKYGVNIIRYAIDINQENRRIKEEDMFRLRELAYSHKLDGILFIGWDEAYSEQLGKHFYNMFKDVPKVSLGHKIKDIPSVVMEGKLYIKELLEHLIETHHYKKIIFASPLFHDERYYQYVKSMKQYSLYDPNFIINPQDIQTRDLFERGQEIVKLVLDKRNIKPDVIMSMYTEETTGIFEELKERNMKVPKDIAVTSYEEGDADKLLDVALTSIYFPWREIGYYGCEKLIKILLGEETSFYEDIPSRLSINESCGCKERSWSTVFPYTLNKLRKSESTLSHPNKTMDDEIIKKNISEELIRTFPCVNINTHLLLDAMLRDYYENTSTHYLNMIRDEFYDFIINNQSNFLIEDIEKVFDLLHHQFIFYYIHSEEEYKKFREIIDNVYIYIRMKMATVINARHKRIRTLQYDLYDFGKELLTSFNIDECFRILENNLSRFSIPGCYIFLFEDETKSYDNCRLVFNYSKECKLFDDDKTYYIKDFASRLRGKGLNITCQMLEVQSESIGVVFFEYNIVDEHFYSLVAMQISSAIKGANLLTNLKNTQKELVEKAHKAGMAEVATDSLHNIGNVLNSINISLQNMQADLKDYPLQDYNMACDLLETQMDHLDEFMSKEGKGPKLLSFYLKLRDRFNEADHKNFLHVNRLIEKVDLIKKIILHQKYYASKDKFLEEVSLRSLMLDAINIIDKKGCKIINNINESIKIMAVKIQVTHIFINVLKNAVEAMGNTPKEDKIITIDSKPRGELIQVSISDKGHGIEAHLIDRIFEHGFSTKESGQGFGLHSCANYMAQMGGAIRAESQGLGKGTTFILEFRA